MDLHLQLISSHSSRDHIVVPIFIIMSLTLCLFNILLHFKHNATLTQQTLKFDTAVAHVGMPSGQT